MSSTLLSENCFFHSTGVRGASLLLAVLSSVLQIACDKRGLMSILALVAGTLGGLAYAAQHLSRGPAVSPDSAPEEQEQQQEQPGADSNNQDGTNSTRRKRGSRRRTTLLSAGLAAAVCACMAAAAAMLVLRSKRRRGRGLGGRRSSQRSGRIPLKDVIRFKERQWFLEEIEGSRDGDPNAMLRLAKMYLHGQGCPRNIAMAQEWVRKARSLGVGATLDELFATDDPDAKGKLRQLIIAEERRRSMRRAAAKANSTVSVEPNGRATHQQQQQQPSAYLASQRQQRTR